MMESVLPLWIGFGTSFGLILAIGAQNAFVLRCGLRRQHVFWVCGLCALSDAILIVLGITSVAWLGEFVPWLEWVALMFGIVFLSGYGLLRIRAFWSMRKRLEHQPEAAIPSLGRTLLVTLALTWLNPHVYIDTVFLIGAVALPYKQAGQIFAFGLGAIGASLLFFFSLGYIAQWLAPLFGTPRRWRYVELGTGLVMLVIAGHLTLVLYDRAFWIVQS